MLFTWGLDITVDTLRVSEDGHPVDYDVVCPLMVYVNYCGY